MLAKSPGQIIAARKKNDGQGIVGIFRGIRAQYTVTFDERRNDARLHDQPAAADDGVGERHARLLGGGRLKRTLPWHCRRTLPWYTEDRFRAVPDGFVRHLLGGIVGGNDHLSEVDAHEKKRMKEFGYISSPGRNLSSGSRAMHRSGT